MLKLHVNSVLSVRQCAVAVLVASAGVQELAWIVLKSCVVK